MLNNAPNPSDTGPAPQPNAAAPNFPASNFPVPGAPAPSHGVPGSYGVVYVPTQPVALRAAMGCAIAAIVLATLSSLYMMIWNGVDFDDFSWIGFAVIGGLVIWQLWQGARWAHILVIVHCALYLLLTLTGLLLLPFLRQGGVPVLEGARMVGTYHHGDPNVFFVLALGSIAIDIALRIAIIVLLTRPQVGRYIHMRGDLRRMGVK